MLKITGYSDEISVKPGDTISFMVNCEHSVYQTDIIRVISGDLNPQGPGIIEEVIDTPASGTYRGRKQTIHAGSYAMVPSSGPLESLGNFTVQVMVWPSTLRKGMQALVAKFSNADKSGWALIINQSGGIAFVVGDGKGKLDTISVVNRWPSTNGISPLRVSTPVRRRSLSTRNRWWSTPRSTTKASRRARSPSSRPR